MRPKWWQLLRSALARDITLAMTAKVLLLAALFALLARPALRSANDALATATAVLGAAPGSAAPSSAAPGGAVSR